MFRLDSNEKPSLQPGLRNLDRANPRARRAARTVGIVQGQEVDLRSTSQRPRQLIVVNHNPARRKSVGVIAGSGGHRQPGSRGSAAIDRRATSDIESQNAARRAHHAASHITAEEDEINGAAVVAAVTDMPEPISLRAKSPAVPPLVAVRSSITEKPAFDALALAFATVPVPKQGAGLPQSPASALIAAARFSAVSASLFIMVEVLERVTCTAVAVLGASAPSMKE